MTNSATYAPGHGVLLSISSRTEGQTILVSDSMNVAALENHIRELAAWLS